MAGLRARLWVKLSAVALGVALVGVSRGAVAQGPQVPALSQVALLQGPALSQVLALSQPAVSQVALSQVSPWLASPLSPPIFGQIFPPFGPTVQPAPYTPATPPPSTSYGYSPTSSRRDILSNDAHSWPVLRASNGVGVHLVSGAPRVMSYDFDVAAGYRWAFHRRAFLVLEGGYGFTSEPTSDGHFGTIGAGPEIYFNRFVGLGWTPKFVIGEAARDLAIGVRNTLTVPLVMRVFTVELGHQYLRIGDAEQHEVRGQIGVDLAATAHLVLWLLVSPGY